MNTRIEFTKQETETLKEAIKILEEYANITNNIVDHIKSKDSVEKIKDILNAGREG